MGVWDEVQAAATALRTDGETPRVGIVLGSGLGAFADRMTSARRVPYADIPHFPPPQVAGHRGEMVLGDVSGVPCAVMSGRWHYYEGHSMARVALGVRTLAALGVKKLIVTNAAGGIHPSLEPGDFMVIGDHINLTAQSPLFGPNEERFGPRFLDMTEAYARSGRRAWERSASLAGVPLRHGVYVALPGPTYETPSEVRMLARLGADAVGMSTVAEVIAARHMGLSVAGLSVIANKAAGLSPTTLSHREVTETAERVRGSLCDLLTHMVKAFDDEA